MNKPTRMQRLRMWIIGVLAARDIGVIVNMEFHGTLRADARYNPGPTIVLRCRFSGHHEQGAYVRINDLVLTETMEWDEDD